MYNSAMPMATHTHLEQLRTDGSYVLEGKDDNLLASWVDTAIGKSKRYMQPSCSYCFCTCVKMNSNLTIYFVMSSK